LLVQIQKSGELIILLSLILKTWKIWVIYLSHEIRLWSSKSNVSCRKKIKNSQKQKKLTLGWVGGLESIEMASDIYFSLNLKLPYLENSFYRASKYRTILKIFYFSSRTCSQIWLSPLVNDCQPNYIKNLRKKKKTLIHALFYYDPIYHYIYIIFF